MLNLLLIRTLKVRFSSKHHSDASLPASDLWDTRVGVHLMGRSKSFINLRSGRNKHATWTEFAERQLLCSPPTVSSTTSTFEISRSSRTGSSRSTGTRYRFPTRTCRDGPCSSVARQLNCEASHATGAVTLAVSDVCGHGTIAKIRQCATAGVFQSGNYRHARRPLARECTPSVRQFLKGPFPVHKEKVAGTLRGAGRCAEAHRAG
jgi:hypothetical protein